jgi:hypothetical protein
MSYAGRRAVLLGENPGDELPPAADSGFVEHRFQVLLNREW